MFGLVLGILILGGLYLVTRKPAPSSSSAQSTVIPPAPVTPAPTSTDTSIPDSMPVDTSSSMYPIDPTIINYSPTFISSDSASSSSTSRPPLPNPVSSGNTINLKGLNNMSPASVKDKWGDDVVIVGDGRDSTILRASSTGEYLLKVDCKNLRIKNLTLDGNYKVQHCIGNAGDFSITMENCRIMRGIHICSIFDAGRGATVRNCIYEKGGKEADLQAFGGQGGVLFENNYMDRRQSLGPGSCLTFGEGRNITVQNNTMIGINKSWGISIEPWGHPGGYNNVLIQNNHLINAKLVIGGAFINTSYTTPINNVRVLNNTIENGVIEVNGPDPKGQFAKMHGVPDAGLGYNQVTGLVIKGNQVGSITKVGMLKNVDIQSV